MDTINPILEVDNLSVTFTTERGLLQAVDSVNFRLDRGDIVGIVGETGCGKSVTAAAIMGLVPCPPGTVSGDIRFKGQNLLGAKPEIMRKIRGSQMAMVFQDPMTALNPVLTIGMQIAEVLMLHQRLGKKKALARAAELLSLVGIPSPSYRLTQYPHQLSGGMRQRVMIAMALALNPEVLIADEPTTALDVTVQAQIIALLKQFNAQLKTSIIIITHDLGVVAGLCRSVLVMYAGRIVEAAPVNALFAAPGHPYTLGLLNSLPAADRRQKPLMPIPGQPPNLTELPAGCAFLPRCTLAMNVCRIAPPLFSLEPGHVARCWLHHELSPRRGANLREGGKTA